MSVLFGNDSDSSDDCESVKFTLNLGGDVDREVALYNLNDLELLVIESDEAAIMKLFPAEDDSRKEVF